MAHVAACAELTPARVEVGYPPGRMSPPKVSKNVSKKAPAPSPVEASKKAPRRASVERRARATATGATSARAPAPPPPVIGKAAAPGRKTRPASSQETVEGYIGSLSGWQSSVVRTICNIVRATAPNAREFVHESQPIYEENGPFCYVQALSGTVTFGFWRGSELNDPRRLLRGDGDKVRHVRLTGERDVDPRAFAAFVKQAVELNRRLGDPIR